MRALQALDRMGAFISSAAYGGFRSTPARHQTTKRSTDDGVIEFPSRRTHRMATPPAANLSQRTSVIIGFHEPDYQEYSVDDLIITLAAHSHFLSEEDLKMIFSPFSAGVKAIIIKELLVHNDPKVREAAEILLRAYPPINELNRQAINRLVQQPDLHESARRVYLETPVRLPNLRSFGLVLSMLASVALDQIRKPLR